MRLSVSTASRIATGGAVILVMMGARPHTAAQDPTKTSPQFRFESRVDLVNVTVTVSDASGRFVPGLTKEDFALFEDDKPQEVSLFFSERVPVSLGIALDTSGSMQGEKFNAARDALERFLGQLLDPTDEIFLYRFDDEVQLLQGWTTRRDLLRQALGRISPRGATMLYDAVAAAVPFAQTGHHRKKALVVISDGNDTSSNTKVPELKQLIRETEVLVYAVGIDGQAEPTVTRRPPRFPLPVPIPGRGGRNPFPPGRAPLPPQPPPGPAPAPATPRPDARVNVLALRELTDESGGRTETIRTVYDLDPATASVANELSRQYYLGYQSPSAGDGKWHSLRVEVRNHTFHVRARSGFTATPSTDTAKRPPLSLAEVTADSHPPNVPAQITRN